MMKSRWIFPVAITNDLNVAAYIDTCDDIVDLQRLTRATCPKDEDWFVRGGKCGWADECKSCDDNPKTS